MDETFDFCRPYLENGEYIVWKGRPERGNLLVPGDVFMIPFSLFWCGFVIFWETMVITSGAPFPFALFGAIFLCVGLYLVFGRFVHSAYLRRHSAYVITNRKILRRQGRQVDMLEGRSLPAIHWRIHKNGNGTVQFGSESIGTYDALGRPHTYINRNLFTLYNVADVARVQQALRDIER